MTHGGSGGIRREGFQPKLDTTASQGPSSAISSTDLKHQRFCDLNHLLEQQGRSVAATDRRREQQGQQHRCQSRGAEDCGHEDKSHGGSLPCDLHLGGPLQKGTADFLSWTPQGASSEGGEYVTDQPVTS